MWLKARARGVCARPAARRVPCSKWRSARTRAEAEGEAMQPGRGSAVRKQWLAAAAAAAAIALAAAPAGAQETGTVQGTVTLVGDIGPVHGALVLVVGTGATALTEDDGTYVLENVPAGSYEVLAQREHLTAGRQMITVAGGGVVTVDFVLAPSPVHEQVTVTAAAGGTQTTFEAFNAVTTLDSYDLVQGGHGTLGEALQNEPGIAVRSFGPARAGRSSAASTATACSSSKTACARATSPASPATTASPSTPTAPSASRSSAVRPPCSTGRTPPAASSTSSRRRRPCTSRCSRARAPRSPPTPGAPTRRPASAPTCSTRPATSACGPAAAPGAPATTTPRRAPSPTPRPSS